MLLDGWQCSVFPIAFAERNLRPGQVQVLRSDPQRGEHVVFRLGDHPADLFPEWGATKYQAVAEVLPAWNVRLVQTSHQATGVDHLAKSHYGFLGSIEKPRPVRVVAIDGLAFPAPGRNERDRRRSSILLGSVVP